MGAVNTTYTFTATDTITSTKMNNIIDQTTITDEAIIGNTLEVASGKLKVRAQGITSNELATNAVTTTAITNGSVTPEKLSSGGISWSSVETKIGPSVTGAYYVSLTPSRTGDGETRIRIGAQTNTLNNATIVRDSGENGNLVFTNNGTGNITLSSAGGVTFGSSNMPTPSGSAPIYGVRAWANFDAQSNNDLAGLYSRSGTAVTVTATAHGLIAGNLIFIDFTVGTGTAPFDGLYVVDSVTDANTFTVTSSASTASTGTATLKRKTIRGSGNISCISAATSSPVIPPTSSDSASNGYYIANFSVAMPNSNFAILGTCSQDGQLSTGSGNDGLNGSPYNEKCALITAMSYGSNAVAPLYGSFSIIG